jgi:ribosomal protein S18 acetylase RimI-like enzyme
LAFGDVFLSDDRKACALLLFPEKKRLSVTTIWWDIKLVLQCSGLKNVWKVMRREAKIKALQPGDPFYYLWYIGVDPAWQKKGSGSQLLNEVIAEGERPGTGHLPRNIGHGTGALVSSKAFMSIASLLLATPSFF